jgi:hypothetical protein
MLNEEYDIVSEIKSNDKLTKKEQIKKYMDYLLNDCNYRLPDIFLEFIAREKLEYKYTEQEIKNMREHFLRRQEEIEDQNKLADIKEEQAKNNKVVIEEIKEQVKNDILYEW